MKIKYTEILDKDGNLECISRSDGWSIPINPENTDYQQYLASLNETDQL